MYGSSEVDWLNAKRNRNILLFEILNQLYHENVGADSTYLSIPIRVWKPFFDSAFFFI
jgi:hypothetical protein